MTSQKIKKEDYQSWADCIRSDQVPADRIYAIWQENPAFYRWYKKQYLKKTAA
jgi:hypothetical protein